MKTKTKKLLDIFTKSITINKLKKALKEDKKLIKKIKFYDEDRYTVTQNKEIKEVLLSLVDGCLDFLVHYKDFGIETANLIEYKDDILVFYDDQLAEATKEIFKTDCDFFKLETEEEQDKVLDHIVEEDDVDLFCFWDFIDDELDELTGSYLSDDEPSNAVQKYFVNTRKLRESLI